jgi:hypothetical protein
MKKYFLLFALIFVMANLSAQSKAVKPDVKWFEDARFGMLSILDLIACWVMANGDEQPPDKNE